MKYKVKPCRRYVPDRVFIADLRKTAKRLRKKHISYNEYLKGGEFHPATLFKRFGSWNAALLKAGLKVKYKPRASEDELLLNLKNIWDVLGRQPLFDEMKMKMLSRYSPYTYVRRFGSWNRALFALERAVKKGKLKNAKNKKQKYSKQNNTNRKVKVSSKNLHIGTGLRYDVLNRDRFRCCACGASPANDLDVKLHVDHIIPISKGGKSILSNLQTLCSDCNFGKGTKLFRRISKSNIKIRRRK